MDNLLEEVPEGAMADFFAKLPPLPKVPTHSTPHLTPYTPPSTPYNLGTTPHTLHPTPCTLFPALYISNPSPYTLHTTLYTLHPAPHSLHPTFQIPQPKPYTRLYTASSPVPQAPPTLKTMFMLRGLGVPRRVSGRKVDIRLPGEGNLNCHGARPVHQIIWMIT